MLTTPVAESGKSMVSSNYNRYSVHTCELEYIGGWGFAYPPPSKWRNEKWQSLQIRQMPLTIQAFLIP